MDSSDNIKEKGAPNGELKVHDLVSTPVGAAPHSMVLCNTCNKDKPTSDFYRGRKKCKPCRQATSKINYEKNKEKNKEKRKLHYQENKKEIYQRIDRWRKKNEEKVKLYHKKYWIANRTDFIAYQKEYQKKNKVDLRKKANKRESERRKIDVGYRIQRNLKARVYFAVKEKGSRKHARTMELVGCTIEFLKSHLEKQFDHRMTWDNYCSFWEVDHIIPLSSFDLTKEEEQKKAFHWSNLQPLEGKENRSKGAKIGPEYKNQIAA